MATYRKIISECTAHTYPSSDSPVGANLEPDVIVRVIGDENSLFFVAAVFGKPLYIHRDNAVASSEEEFRGQKPTTQKPSLADTETGEQREGTLAGFVDRFSASVFDAILLNVVFVAIGLTLRLTLPSAAIRLTAFLLVALGIFAYLTYLNANGGTWGKRLVSIRIVNEHTAAAPGLSRALIRQFAAIVSAIPLYLGYFWMIWDKKKRTWHDIATGTICCQV